RRHVAAVGALVRGPRGREVVPAPDRGAGRRRDASRAAAELPHARRGGPRPDAGDARAARVRGRRPKVTDSAAREAVFALRRTFESGRSRPVEWRRAQLLGLRRLLLERASEFERALAADLGKCSAEAWATEIGPVLAEADHARRCVARWARPTRVLPSLVQLPARARVASEPRGVVAILAPWNYPLNLTLAPLVGALAAGNCVVLKPSE